LANFLSGSPSFTLGYEVAAQRFGDSADLRAGFGLAAAQHGFGPLIVGTLVALAGLALAYFFHLRNRPAAASLARGLRFITRPMEAKFWVDEIYQWTIVEPLRLVGRLMLLLDAWVVDGLVKLAGAVPWVAGMTLKLGVQRGYLQGYAVAMLFGLAAILLVIFL
jgi:NADH-quinone oxidoreductase subunit L